MKKKTVRKVSSAKKSISKKSLSNKKKFSLKSWLLGGLVLLLALAYGYYQTQPKTFKVIELAGQIEDYIKPSPVDINQIRTGSVPKSDIPELNAAAAAAQAKKSGLSETAQKQAAKKAAEDTIRKNAEMEVAHSATPKTDSSNNRSASNIIEEAQNKIKNDAPKIAEEAFKLVEKLDRVVDKDGNAVLVAKPGTNSQVTAGGKCTTSGGMQVLSGSTAIGDVEKTEGNNFNQNKVYECNGGSWTFTGRYCGTGEAMKSCDITLKPTYALKQGQANCYQGDTIIGDGQVTDTQDGKKQCKGGELITAKQLNGQYLSEEDYNKKFQELMDNCTNNGGSWQQVKPESSDWICGAGERAEAMRKSEEEYRKCIANPNQEWVNGGCKEKTNTPPAKTGSVPVVNSKGTKTGGELTTNSTDCIFGATPTGRGDSRSAEFRCNDSTGKVPQTTEKCQAQGTVVVCKVYDLSGKYLSEYRKSPETVKNEVNPGAKLLGGESTSNDKECLYGATPALDPSGKKLAGKFICNDSTGGVPRTLTTTNYGKPSKDTQFQTTNITDNSSDKTKRLGEKCSESYGLYNNFFGNTINNSSCQNQCPTGVYTTVSYGAFGWNKISICGPSDSDEVKTTVNAFKLSEASTKIIGDNKSELTTRKLTQCDNKFGSQNLCSRCEEGIVTDVEISSNKVRFCGAKDEVAEYIKNNPSVIQIDPLNDSSNTDPNLPTDPNTPIVPPGKGNPGSAQETTTSNKDGKANGEGCLAAIQCGSNYCDRSGYWVWNWKCDTNPNTTGVPAQYQNVVDVVQEQSGQENANKPDTNLPTDPNTPMVPPGKGNPTHKNDTLFNLPEAETGTADVIIDMADPTNVFTGEQANNIVEGTSGPLAKAWIQISGAVSNLGESIVNFFKPKNNSSKDTNPVEKESEIQDGAKGERCYIANQGSSEDCDKCPDVPGDGLNYGYDSSRPGWVYCRQ